MKFNASLNSVDKLTNEAIQRGHTRITLSATEMGVALFKQCGFQDIENVGFTEMVYIKN